LLIQIVNKKNKSDETNRLPVDLIKHSISRPTGHTEKLDEEDSAEDGKKKQLQINSGIWEV
jgi:hypothetical protein